jgi:hypothetical protein
MASCGRMDIPSFMKTGAGVQATDIWQTIMLVLLMAAIYELCHPDGVRWHDIYSKFHKDWFWYAKVKRGNTQTHTHTHTHTHTQEGDFISLL